MNTTEIIQSIRHVSNCKPVHSSIGEYDGYAIDTNKQTIYLLIDNGQSCCENWGYLMSHDNFDEFIGAKLLSLHEVTASEINGVPDGAYTVFVNVETDKGTLQFVAYNDHNGYYGHTVHIMSEQLNMTAVV